MSVNPTLMSYSTELIDWEEQIASGTRSVRFILATIGGLTDQLDDRFPGYLGRSRAEAGVPSDELLRALNIDFEMCWAELTADASELERADILSLGSHVWRAIELYSNAVLLAYQQREHELRRAKRLRTDATIASFLARTEHRPGTVLAGIADLGFSPQTPILLLASTQSAEEIEQRLAVREPRALLRLSPLPEGTFGLWQMPHAEPDPGALADVAALWHVPPAPERIPAALRALSTALHSAPPVFGPVPLEATLRPQLAAWLGTTQPYLLERRLWRVGSLSSAQHDRLQQVVDALMDSASLAEAARRLHIHRNTLVQRIAFIRVEAGFDLRIPSQLHELSLLLAAAARHTAAH